jgi:hypothetical protein
VNISGAGASAILSRYRWRCQKTFEFPGSAR